MTTKWVPTADILEKISELAEQRVNEDVIAKAIGLGVSTWYKKKREYPEIQEIMSAARLMKVDIAKGKLWKIVEDEEHRNHLQAVMYFLNKYDDEQVKEEGNPKVDLPSGFTFKVIKSE